MITMHPPPRRTFNPEVTARYGRPTFDPDKLIKYSPKWKWTRLFNFPFRGSHWRPRMLTVVIAIDGGAYINNRTDPASRAAYGVYFGRGCYRNRSGLLDPSLVQSSPRAELEALNYALTEVIAMRRSGELTGWREIIIKSNSEYITGSFSCWIWKWEQNGYTKSNGQPVEHIKSVKHLHAKICMMEQTLDLAVRFWRVDKKWNEEADALVKVALKTPDESD